MVIVYVRIVASVKRVCGGRNTPGKERGYKKREADESASLEFAITAPTCHWMRLIHLAGY
jgi:hypothetical protein